MKKLLITIKGKGMQENRVIMAVVPAIASDFSEYFEGKTIAVSKSIV